LPYKVLIDSPKQTRGINSRTPSSKRNQTIIFLLRQNPDGVGGVQRLSTILTEGLASDYDIQRIIWRGPDWGMPLSFPLFYYKSIRSDAPLVHCDDAFTCLIGSKIKTASDKKVVGAAHGLDLILPIPWYQQALSVALQKLDKITTISRATAEQVKKRGVDPSKIEIIPPAVEVQPRIIKKDDELYRHLEREIGIDLRQKKVLISIGRPVKRKGFDRFISAVFPHLPDDYVYIVAGPKLKSPIWLNTLKPILNERTYYGLLLASGSYGMHDDLVRLSSHPRVFYLNGVSLELRDRLYAAADLFIMPNRSVEGDMEGFGLVALEAAVRGVPVVATGIEGIVDAVIDGENGYCVPEGDNGAMLGIIMALAEDPLKLSALSQKAVEYTERRFSPERVFALYRKLFDGLLNDKDSQREKPV
jgi:glycosyltransferase involved in cell wall biosynthesis